MIWNCRYGWITSRWLCDEGHVGYSCKGCGSLDAAKRAIPHVNAHKLATTTIARKRKRLEKAVTDSQEPHLKKAFVDTGGIDISALIDRSGIVLD